MRAENRWLVWRYSPDGKKLPHDPKKPAGKPIDSTDEKLWVDYDTASKVVEAGGVEGLGFALGDGWAGVDLDDVRDPASGRVTPSAQAIVEQLDSYTEVSPSGTGLKIFIKAWLGRNHKREGLEIYGYGRYFTVTGLHVANTATEPQARANELTELIDREFGAADTEPNADDEPTPTEESAPENEFAEGGRNNNLARIGGSLRRLNFSDEELLETLRAVNRARCKPPLADHEVQQVARSVGRYAPNKAERAIDWMNERHAVLVESGKTIVITERIDPVLKRRVIDRSDFADIKKRYCRNTIKVKVNGKEIKRPLGDYWLAHPGARLYTSIVYDPEVHHPPEVYNLWRGFAITPKQGSWSGLRQHVEEIICCGDPDVFRYFLGWMARMVQKPGRPGEVALVMKGAQGAGKGLLARSLGHVFGQHFVHLARAHQLTGHFNAHIQDAVLVFADEAVWGGDKTNEGPLKAMITEPTLPIERKGRDAYFVKNVLHLMLASNNDWAAPVGVDDRRFCVVEVLPDRVGDHKYFKAIREEMNRGGYEALLYDLLHYDLKGFDHRKPPQTDAAFAQKLHGFTPVQRWWFEKLKNGRLLPLDREWVPEVPRTTLYENYLDAMQKTGVLRRSLETELGVQLRALVKGLGQVRRSVKGSRERCWVFPPLGICRAEFEAAVNKKLQWEPVGNPDDEPPEMGF
jgi:hypothetical protein